MLLRHEIAASLILLLAASAQAQGRRSPLALDWHAPSVCPTGSEVQADVMRLVGSNAVSGRLIRARAAVTSQSALRWMLTLQTNIEGVLGERVLVGKSCRAVTDAAVLTLALTINPDLTLPPPPSAPPLAPNGPGPGLRPTMSSNPESPLLAQSDGRAAVHWAAGTRVGPRWGLFARPLEEYGLGVGANQERMHAWLEAGFASSVAVPSNTNPRAYADFWFLSMRGLGCYSIGGASLDLLPCAGLDWTSAQGKGVNFDQTYTGSISWFSLVFGAQLSWRFQRAWQLQAQGMGLIPMARPEAYIIHAGDEVLLRPSALGARALLGLQWQFY